MNVPLALTLAIAAIAVVLMLTDRLRSDLVALLVVVALSMAGILSPREAFSGFASSAVVTVFAIFVLAQALQQTGVTEQAGRFLLHVAGASEKRLVIVVMLAGARCRSS